jgi:hypothetical protein
LGDLKRGFGDVADLPGFLFNIGLQSIQTPDDLQDLFRNLDGQNKEARKRWLEQFRAYSGNYALYIHAAWANAWFADALSIGIYRVSV